MLKKINNYLRKKHLIGLLTFLPTAAFADSGDAITTVLNGLIGLLQSTPARLLGIVAIIGVGYATIHLGKVPKERAIAIVIGIGFIFGAAYIAGKLGYGT